MVRSSAASAASPPWDAKKALPDYSARVGSFDLVELPSRSYVAIDGAGDPTTSADYLLATATIYPVAYSLKFVSKRELGRDYVVPPLEALWWADDMRSFTTARDKARWSWRLLLLTPPWIRSGQVDAALAAVAAKKPELPVGSVRWMPLDEGLCVQTLHLGPYDDEGPVLARLHDEILPERGLAPTGHHHELYLGDPRRVAPERLRTILRQPVRRLG